MRAVILLVAGIGLGLAVNAVRPDGVSFEPRQVVVSCEVDESTILELSARDAAVICAEPGTIIVDVRPEREFVVGHIPGAIHLPCQADRLGGDLTSLMASAQRVLVYSRDTAGAYQVALSLVQRNYPVRVLAGGYPQWEAAGQACTSGPCETCSGELHVEH